MARTVTETAGPLAALADGAARPFVPASKSLARLAAASRGCRGCPLWARGTQTVFGEGARTARLVLVGEQPDDAEDLAGRPFVGPAGRVLDRALEEAGIDRSLAYVTNAVKHFKWTPRGKRRIHQRPTQDEIDACAPWLAAELESVRPQVLVCLGATAAQALLGRGFRVTRMCGELLYDTGLAPVVMATVHPSSVLRARRRGAPRGPRRLRRGPAPRHSLARAFLRRRVTQRRPLERSIVMNRQSSDLVAIVERELQRAGIDLIVEQDGDRLVLAGSVGTEADRDAALDIVAQFTGDEIRLDTDIEVSGVMPDLMRNADLSQTEIAGFRGADPGVVEDESVMPGDFTDQDTLFAPDDAQSASLADPGITLGGDTDLAADGDSVYVPPTDPVGTDTEVIGGFASSSMARIDVDRSSDGTFGDEAIRDAVLRELREDAATAGLAVEVEVVGGVVTLRGTVADILDVEGAEEVAARVPGVVEVVEEFEVEGLTDT